MYRETVLKAPLLLSSRFSESAVGKKMQRPVQFLLANTHKTDKTRQDCVETKLFVLCYRGETEIAKYSNLRI